MLLAFSILLASYSNFFKTQVNDKISKFFFSNDLKHPLMQNPNKIKKVEEIIFQSLNKQLREKNSLADDL
jgi:hypothetical protein